MKLVARFCEEFNAHLKSITMYNESHWIIRETVLVGLRDHQLRIQFLVPDFMPDYYDVYLPMHTFNDERVMEKHLADCKVKASAEQEEYALRVTNYKQDLAAAKSQRKWWKFWK